MAEGIVGLSIVVFIFLLIAIPQTFLNQKSKNEVVIKDPRK